MIIESVDKMIVPEGGGLPIEDGYTVCLAHTLDMD